MSSSWNQKVNSGKGEGFEKAPIGNHPAVLVAIIDMGKQEQEYGGNVTYPHRAFFVWELVTEKMSGTKERNHLIGIDLTVSLNEKAKLRQWIEARVGKKMPDDAEYDISKELGQKCLLDVIANKKGYPVVNGMKAVPKGLAFPAHQNAPIAITLDDFKTGAVTIPDWVPYLYGEHLADVIRRCEELSEKNDRSGGGDRRVATDDELAAGMEGRGASPVNAGGGPAGTDEIPW
jgi:hypothetical protein